MKIWKKKPEEESSARGVARAALAGASHAELLHEALKTLAQWEPTARLGVWLEADERVSPQIESIAGFHGEVWDRGHPQSQQEWAHLSVEPPLPDELLRRGETVDQDLRAFPSNPILGPLVGLGHALWVPIYRKEHLKGIILAGSSGKPSAISRDRVESVAAELALALGLEEEQRFVRMRKDDLLLVRRLFAQQTTATSPDAFLSSLVESCTGTLGNVDGPRATFAAVGALCRQRENSSERFPIEFPWRSGHDSWTHAIESEPLAGTWRSALEARRVVGSEPRTGHAGGSVTRVVAFPLESDQELLGTLVVGLPAGAASLATLDRLELRALLASAALQRRKRKEEESLLADWPRALLDCLREPVLLLDESGRITAASRGARELTGTAFGNESPRPAGLPAPEPFSQLFRGHHQAQIQTWLRAGIDRETDAPRANHGASRAELHNGVAVRLSLAPAVPGQPKVVLLEPLPTRDSLGDAGLAGIELQNVIEWVEEGVVLFDAQNNIREMNTRFQQIAGLAPEESGKINTLEALIARLKDYAAQPAAFMERWRELARGIEGGVREELQMKGPSPRILERAARPILDPIGRLLGRVEIYRDLTAQRVFHSKLLQTEKLASLGQMVSGVAHELSNPLTSIMGYAHRLLARQERSGSNEEVRQIFQEAERASAILQQLLLNARETLPERRLMSLNQIVHRAMDLQRFSLAAEKVRVEIDLEPALPLVQGDPGHLQQVLMNLVGNARQAIEHHGQGGTIRLRTKRIGERRVLLEVADNGPGISPAILARIFDPFFTTKPVGVGTGLGLAIVLSVVREHGGQVHVLTPPQGGAIFQVELPSAAETAQDEAFGSPLLQSNILLPAPTQVAGRENRFAPAFESANAPRVLVVEDEPTVARLIADVLEDEGMHVEVLLDGREALDRAARQTFDLVICDMKMPGLDGQHFYKSLERSGNPLREKFLFVTGDIVAAHTREFLERHHLPHVAKPFRVEELTEKVRAVLGIEVRHQPPPPATARKNVAGNR